MTVLTARPPWATWLAFTIAGVALVAVVVYLRPLEEPTRAYALIALVVLVAPLPTRQPATIQQLLVCALVWACVALGRSRQGQDMPQFRALRPTLPKGGGPRLVEPYRR
jgi:hypothetical protein